MRAVDAEDQWSEFAAPVGTDVLAAGVGDPDLDGVMGSIGDLALLNQYLGTGIGVFDVYPSIQIGETDFNCDGLAGVQADRTALQQIVLGRLAPCYSGGAARADRSASALSEASAFAGGYAGDFAFQLSPTDFARTDSAWVDIVLTSATDSLVGFQLQLEYDVTRLQLNDLTLGDFLQNWQYLDYDVVDDGLTGRLTIAAVAWDQGDPLSAGDIFPAGLPANLIRLHFNYVQSAGDYETDLNFFWNDCGDNSLSAGGLSGSDVVVKSLVLADEVLDAYGDPVSVPDAKYLGAPGDCFEGLFGVGPYSAVDFQNATVVHEGSCCISPAGDANNDGGVQPTIGDITAMIDALFIAEDLSIIACPAEADVNQSGGSDPSPQDITIGDVTYLIDYLFITGQTLGLPDCP